MAKQLPKLQLYLVTKPANVKQFMLAEDQAYFARPVPVEVIRDHSVPGLLVVRDLVRGGREFPCSRRDIKTKFGLTVKQLQTAHNCNTPSQTGT